MSATRSSIINRRKNLSAETKTSLKITDRSCRYASPCLWNELSFIHSFIWIRQLGP